MKHKYAGIVRWSGYKFPYNIIEFLRWFPRQILDFFSRGWRGFADCDTWDLSYYNARVMVDALTKLRRDTHGWPVMMESFLESETYDDVSMCSYGEILWANILTDMIDGFQAAVDLDRGPWFDTMEPEGEPFSFSGESSLRIDLGLSWSDEQLLEIESLENVCRAKLDDGLALFSEFYLDLWD